MNATNTTYVTTAIDYPNALPHIGTAFEKMGADVYARFRRFQGQEVCFLMGNDENTIKVIQAAGDRDCKEYVDEMACKFKEVWQILDISFDEFIQTSSENHKTGVQYFLNSVYKAGYIEKRQYKALYCEGCEEFKTSSSLVDSKCPNHPNSFLIEREEENYFFLLSKFKQWILDLIYPTPFLTAFLSVEPESRENEIRNFVESELKDISISRKNEGWGIPFPWDSSQSTYVWFDALLSYLTGIGFGTDWEKFNKFYPAEVHFVGKDITRFHAVLFPAMLKAYNEGEEQHKLKAYPQRIFSHGFIYQKEGNAYVKSSKSGSSINPVELIEQFGTDAYRYYFISRCDFGSDGEFELEDFKKVYNIDLANNLGNFAYRVHSMINRYFIGELPATFYPAENYFNSEKWFSSGQLTEYESLILDKCSFKQAIEMVIDLSTRGNQYIEENKPWNLAKEDKEKLVLVLKNLLSNLRLISLLLRPFLPSTAEKIYEMFGQFGSPADAWEKFTWEHLKIISKINFLSLNNKVKINQGSILFPRII